MPKVCRNNLFLRLRYFKAIWISMPIVILIYVSINVAYLAVLTPSEIMSSAALANDMATRTLGPIGGICVPIAVAMSCWGGLNSSMMASSRLFMVGSREGHLPQWISMITFKGNSGTPAPGKKFPILFNWFFSSDDFYWSSDDTVSSCAKCIRPGQLLQLHILAYCRPLCRWPDLSSLHRAWSSSTDQIQPRLADHLHSHVHNADRRSSDNTTCRHTHRVRHDVLGNHSLVPLEENRLAWELWMYQSICEWLRESIR